MLSLCGGGGCTTSFSCPTLLLYWGCVVLEVVTIIVHMTERRQNTLFYLFLMSMCNSICLFTVITFSFKKCLNDVYVNCLCLTELHGFAGPVNILFAPITEKISMQWVILLSSGWWGSCAPWSPCWGSSATSSASSSSNTRSSTWIRHLHPC